MVYIESIDNHRNGVGGVPFYAAIVLDEVDGASGRFLVQVEDDVFTGDKQISDGRFASVLDLSQAADGNIYSDPHLGSGGGNAWRADRLVPAWLPALREAFEESQQAQDIHQRNEDHKRKVAHENAVDDLLEAHGLGVSSTEAFEQIATIFNPMVVGRFAEDRGATLELLADRGFSVAETGQIHRVEGGSA